MSSEVTQSEDSVAWVTRKGGLVVQDLCHQGPGLFQGTNEG